MHPLQYLVCKIPQTAEPGRVQSMGSQKIGLDWAHRHILEKVMISYFSSVQFSHSVVSDSLWPHGLQHARPPYPSPTPGVYSNSCSLSWWCHPTISCLVIPFSSCPQSFPASGSFQKSQLFASGGQNIRVS